MPVRLLEAIEKDCYLTDGQRLVRVLSISRSEVLIEDAFDGREEILSAHQLAAPMWRRVEQAA